ncbi:chitin binding beak protein 1 [Elysia marginata]|uniref:Chitin binding beak protein 1 n=1 Tax=Elysia marginata TaxID=1093978 RepID=A0AAV4G6R0_9GAST|nr:chitin binding beak protein 1 [Elysia marginata]
MAMEKIRVVVPSLFVVAAGAVFSSVSAYYARNLNLDFLCSPGEQTAYVTHIPWDCAGYVICMNGQAIPTPCPPGKLYASASENSKCEPAAQVDASRCHQQIWNYIQAICSQNPTAVVHDAERCGQYLDCTVTNENTIVSPGTASAASASGSGVVTRAPSEAAGQVEMVEYLLECPYPGLFSTQTGTCQDFRAVTCGEREEPKAPCDYLQYLQIYDCNGFECAACKQHHPSCVGLPNGQHPVPGRSGVIMECQGERTVNIFLATRQSISPLVGASGV